MNIEIIKKTILKGREEVFYKREKELSFKLKNIIDQYKKIESENYQLFENYHSSFYQKNDEKNIPDQIKFFSDKINELEINEYDLDIVVDNITKKTLLDFILEYKPYLSLNNFSLGGSYKKIGKKILEKIFLSGDREYVKYLEQVGFLGKPQLFLEDIGGKKVIDYLIENYDEFYDLNVIDYDTKKYIFDSIKLGKYNVIKNGEINLEKIISILDKMQFNSNELLNEIEVQNKNFNIMEIYLNKDKLRNIEKLKNTILHEDLLVKIINKYLITDNIILKNELKDILNNILIENNVFEKLDKKLIEKLENDGIILNVEKEIKDIDNLFETKLKELSKELKLGIETSDDLIKYLIDNYKKAYIENPVIALKEVQTILLIKINNPKFHLEDSNVGPNFVDDTIHLILSDDKHQNFHGHDNYFTLNHEMTHAMQYYCYDDNFPLEFYRYLPKKEEVLDDIAIYSENIISKLDEIVKCIKNNLIQKGINDCKINEILEKEISYYSINKYCAERGLIDIFDCMYPFTDFLEQLGFKKAKYIEGHPYDYMNYRGYDFSEMLAEYKALLFSGRKDLIELEKRVLKDDLFLFIESFYEKMLDNYILRYSKEFTKYISSNNEKVK